MSAKILKILEEHTQQFNHIFARFDQVDARFDQHDARFDQHDARFVRLEGKFDMLREEFHNLGLKQEDMGSRFDQMLEIVQSMYERPPNREKLEESLENHEVRISALELHTRNKN